MRCKKIKEWRFVQDGEDVNDFLKLAVERDRGSLRNVEAALALAFMRGGGLPRWLAQPPPPTHPPAV